MPYERLDLDSCLYTTLIIDGADPGHHILHAVHSRIKFPLNIYFPAGNHNNKKLCLLQVPFNKAPEVLKLNDSTIKGRKVKVYYPKANPKCLKYIKWVKELGRKDAVKAMTFDVSPVPAHLKLTADLSGDLTDVGYDLTHAVAMDTSDTTLMEARDRGIRWINIPGSSFKHMEKAMKLVEDYKEFFPIYFSAGIHPRYEYTCHDIKVMIKKLEDIYKHPRCHTIGLIGLDYRKEVEKRTSLLGQKVIFEKQLELACKHKKPVFLVQYEAHEDFMKIISRFRDNLPLCAMYDFSQKIPVEHLEQYSDLGFYFAINGFYENVFFRKELDANIARAIRCRIIKLSQILLASHGPMSGRNTEICRYYESPRYPTDNYSFPNDVTFIRDNILGVIQVYLKNENVDEEQLTKILRENGERFLGYQEDCERRKNCADKLQEGHVGVLLSKIRSSRYFNVLKFFVLNVSLYVIILYAIFYFGHFIV